MGIETEEYESVICINCFKDIDTSIGDGEICPHCGTNNHKLQIPNALPFRTVLQERFVIGRVKGANGEGFTYKAFDENTQTVVEIREFCPVTLTYRKGTEIFPSAGKENELSFLYKDFLVLANSLTSVGILNAVIPVITTFIENNTCYIVYKYYESISLTTYVDSKGGTLDYNTVQAIFTPLINSLSTMHSLGIRHLGISPTTLRICKDGKMRLAEFSSSNLSRTGSPLTPKLTSGTAAIEQYTEEKLGEYTDVYAVAACMLYAISGRLPTSAPKRLENPSLYISGDVLRTLPNNLITSIANALQVEVEDRTKTFAQFRDSLFPKEEKTEKENQIVQMTKNIVDKTTRPSNKIRGNRITLILSFLISGVVLYFLISSYVNDLDITLTDVFTFFTETIEGIDQDETVVVPNLVGESYESWAAKVAINPDYDFEIEVTTYQLSNTINEGYVITQYPSAYSEMESGGTITVAVSLGPTTRTLPAVASKTYGEAVELLEADGFVVQIELQKSDTAEDGIVLWYGDDRNVGDTLDYGSVVILVVSGTD